MKIKTIVKNAGICTPVIMTWKRNTYKINRIHLPIQGTIFYNDINGKKVIDEGSVYFLFNSCSQDFEPLPEYPYYHLYVDYKTIPPFMSRELLEVKLEDDQILFYLLGSIQAIINNCKKTLQINELRPKNAFEMEQITNIMNVIISHIIMKYKIKIIDNPKIVEAINYIELNYAKIQTISDIADALHIHPRHMIRIFTKHIGITPYHYLTQCRVAHAINFLKDSKPISEISDLCGYQSENAFRIAFKKVMGCSPTMLSKQEQWSND